MYVSKGRRKKVTLFLDDDILEKSREYARGRNLSLNSLILQLLMQEIGGDSENWLSECFGLMDKAGGNSAGRGLRRVDFYDV